MFFVTHPSDKGPINGGVIKQIEQFLIDTAYAKNPKLTKVHNAPKYDWKIRGVVRPAQGEATAASAEFKRAVGIK